MDLIRELTDLTEQMGAMSDCLEKLADDTEYTIEATDRLDATRVAAMKLYDTIEAILTTLAGE
jgi:hypothetical protein